MPEERCNNQGQENGSMAYTSPFDGLDTGFINFEKILEYIPDAAQNLDRLLVDLEEHLRNQGNGFSKEPREKRIHQAICIAITITPQELGNPGEPSRLCLNIHDVLSTVRSSDISESHACKLWLECSLFSEPPDASAHFVEWNQIPLWRPVKALVTRALAHFGMRRHIRGFPTQKTPVDVMTADAWLNAALPMSLEGPDFCDLDSDAGLNERWKKKRHQIKQGLS